MSLFHWLLALAYPVGNLVLWHRVERERVPQPDDALGDREPLSVWRPPQHLLTPLGWRRWRAARRFTVLGLAAWITVVAVLFLG